MFSALKNRILAGRPKADSTEVMGQYYRRTGECTLCGLCCRNIYLIHNEQTITSREQFEALKPFNPEYTSFRPMDETEHGLTFACIHLQPDNTCGVYAERPDFCRRYPHEDGLLKGGYIPPECGYRFTLLRDFKSVLAQTASMARPRRTSPMLRRIQRIFDKINATV